MLRSLLIAILLASVLFASSGCGVAYRINRDKLLSTATETDYGPPPPENHQDIAAQVIRQQLKDPDSAQFQFGGIARDAIQTGPMSPTAMLVWRTSALVNAKNSYGGYTGFQPWHLAWKNGRVIAIAPPIVMRGGEVVDGMWQYLP